MTSEAKTTTDGAGSVSDIAVAAANAAAAQAAAAVAADASSSYQRDYSGVSARVSDNDKDVGADERYEATGPDNWDMGFLNKKRTADQYQSIDTAELAATRRHAASLSNLEIRTAEQTLLHQAKLNALEIEMKQAEHNQRLRHADFQVTALAAVTKEMVETIADRTAAKVCASLKS